MPSIEQIESRPRIKQMPRRIELPNPSNSPFKPWSDEHYNTVLISFDNKQSTTIIFTDGSCPVNPGYGGAGIIIYPSNMNQITDKSIKISHPIQGITTNIGAEIAAIKKAIEWIDKNIKDKQERIVIFSDCKPVINSITNRTKPKHYGHAIRSIQKQIKELSNVPEIYWIKAHIGITGNKLADEAAKQGAEIAMDIENDEENENQLGIKVADEAGHLSSMTLSEDMLKQWNNEWINPNRKQHHTWCKYLIPDVETSKDLFHKLFTSLKTQELRIISRLISGHVNLRHYMHSIGYATNPYCKHCRVKKQQIRIPSQNKKRIPSGKREIDDDESSSEEEESNVQYEHEYPETIRHFLLECKAFEKERNNLFNKILKQLGDKHSKQDITIKLLLTGYPCDKWKTRKLIVKHTVSFVKETNKMNI